MGWGWDCSAAVWPSKATVRTAASASRSSKLQGDELESRQVGAGLQEERRGANDALLEIIRKKEGRRVKNNSKTGLTRSSEPSTKLALISSIQVAVPMLKSVDLTAKDHVGSLSCAP